MFNQQNRRIPMSGLVAGIAAIAVVAGGGAAWWHWQSSQKQTPIGTPNSISGIQEAPSATQAPPASQKVEVFWLKKAGVRQQLIATTADTTTNSQQQPAAALKAAFNNLLAGPKDKTVSTTIPQGTKLRSLKVEKNGIHVNLSPEFASGGGSTAMTGRVAQVIYTATSLDRNAKVWIEVEGKPLSVLGGEGLELEQPLTRKSLGENFTL